MGNWKNRTIWTGDNLPILRGMNSESVDLIYLDPPFNSKHDYSAPIGSEAAGAEFKDTWGMDDVKAEWLGLIEEEYPKIHKVIEAAFVNSDRAYLIYMARRLIELHRILKNTGSIYLHCDPIMSHYLKLLMDAICGRESFRNEIVWHYRKWTNAARHFQKNHDVLFMYSKGDPYAFNKQYVSTPHKDSVLQRGWDKNTISGIRQLLVYDRARAASEIAKRRHDKIVYMDDKPSGVAVPDVWTDINYIASSSRERIGYPTQKPLALLKRVIQASSSEGDMVLDPFCGCATTCVVAEIEQRNWSGIDISKKAAELVQSRLEKHFDGQLFKYQGIHRTDIPKRTDQGKIKPYNDPENKELLFGQQRGCCRGCGEHFIYRNFTIDHITPQAKGGTDHIDNLQLLCGACNSEKGKKSMEEFMAGRKRNFN